MKRPSTQSVLKVALLVVLTASVKLPKPVQVTQMSSRETSPARPVTDSISLNLGDVETTPPPLAASDSIPTDGTPFVHEICGEDYQLKFSEVKEGSLTRIKLVASLGTDTTKTAQLVHTGRLREIAKDENGKLDLVNSLSQAITKHSCAAGSPTAETVEFDQADRQAPTNRSGINTCVLDRNGRTYSNDAALTCNTAILEKIGGLDRTSSMNETQDAKKRVVDAFQRAKKILKAGLISDNDDDVDDASGKIDDLISTITNMTYSGIDARTKNKMIEELRAMKTGADTRRKAQALNNKTTDMNQQFQDAYAKYQTLDQKVRNDTRLNEQQKLQLLQQGSNQLMSLFQQHNQLSQRVDQTMAQNIADMQSFQTQGALNSGDMSLYMSPYQNLQKSLLQMVNPAAMGATNLLYTPRDPYYAMSSTSLMPQVGDMSMAAALYQQNAGMTGNILPLTQQQMATYGLGSGALIGQQQFSGANLSTPGIMQNQMGPQQLNPMAMGNGNVLLGSNYSNTINPNYANGSMMNLGNNGALSNSNYVNGSRTNLGMNNGSLYGSQNGSMNGSGINSATGMGVGAIGPVNGNQSGLATNTIGGNSIMFRQNGIR